MKCIIILSMIVVVGLSFAEGRTGLRRPVLQRRQASFGESGEALRDARQEEAETVSGEDIFARQTEPEDEENEVDDEDSENEPEESRDARYYVSEEVRDARGAPAAAARCFRTGCAPVGLKAYCGAGIVEVARETCISGRIDVTCCTAGAVPDNSPSVPVVPRNNGGIIADPNKGQWVQGGKCFTTGCAPVGLPAYCPANVRETSRTQCIAQGRIDVTCCL